MDAIGGIKAVVVHVKWWMIENSRFGYHIPCLMLFYFQWPEATHVATVTKLGAELGGLKI